MNEFIQDKEEKLDADVQRIINSKNEPKDPDIKEYPDEIVTSVWIKFAQYTLVLIYGTITIFGICALCIYFADVLAETFEEPLGEVVDYTLIGVLIANLIG
eukprot:410583_1